MSDKATSELTEAFNRLQERVTALEAQVIYLEELELQEDFQNLLSPGSTTALRRAREQEAVTVHARRAAKREKLRAEGTPEEILEYLLQGYSPDKARELVTTMQVAHDNPHAGRMTGLATRG